MTSVRACDCGDPVVAETDEAFPDAYVSHVRAVHPDWPFPDLAVQVVGEALLRLTGGRERLEQIGEVTVAPVTPDHIDDWLAYFDHDAFVDKPWVAGCYCVEQHGRLAEPALGAWRANRATMVELLESGTAYGYLAYVDGRPAGWVNAAMRRDQVYADGNPDDGETITVSCFNIAPPYRRHGLQAALLDRVIADAAGRGARWIEAFPAQRAEGVPPGAFRGSRALFLSRGFEVAIELEAIAVVRRPA